MANLLPDQGFRFIYRASAHPQCGIWIRPEFVKPGDIDCTDWTDDEFEDFLAAEDTKDAAAFAPCFDRGCGGCEECADPNYDEAL